MFGVLVCGFLPRYPTQSRKSSTAMKRTLGLVCSAAVELPAARAKRTRARREAAFMLDNETAPAVSGCAGAVGADVAAPLRRGAPGLTTKRPVAATERR